MVYLKPFKYVFNKILYQFKILYIYVCVCVCVCVRDR